MALERLLPSKAAKKAHTDHIKKVSSRLKVKAQKTKKAVRKGKPENLAKKSMEISRGISTRVSENQEQACMYIDAHD